MGISVSRDLAAYGAGLLLYKLVQLVLVPIVARGLAPSELGVLEVLLVTSTLTTLCSEFNLQVAVGSLMHGAARERQNGAITAAIAGNLLLSVLVIAGSVPLGGVLATHIPTLQGRQELVVLAVCNGVFSGMTHLYATLWQLLFKPARYNALFVGGSILSLALTVVWFVAEDLPRGAIGPLTAVTIANGITAVAGLWTLRQLLDGRDWRQMARNLALIALPLAPFSLGSWMLGSVDRYFLAAFRQPAELGLYAAAARIAAMATVAFAPFQAAWYPRALASWSTPDRDRMFDKALRNLVCMGGLFVAALGLASPLLIELVMSSKYAGAERAASALIFASLFSGLLYVPLATIMAAGRPAQVSLAYLAAAAVSCLSNLILVPAMGITGAALAMIISQSTLVATLIAFGRQSQRYGISAVKLTSALIAIAIVSVAIVFLHAQISTASYLMVAVAAWGTLLLLLYKLGWMELSGFVWIRDQVRARL